MPQYAIPLMIGFGASTLLSGRDQPAAAPQAAAAPTTVMASRRAQADQLKRKQRRYRTAMGGDYGELKLGKPGMLGV